MVDKKFVDEIDEIFKTRPEAHSSISAACAPGESQISDRMREIRKMDVPGKLSLYLAQRVKDQKDWYKNKALFNAKKETHWFFGIMVCEFLAIVFAFFLISSPSSSFNPIGLMTTLAAIFCAWTQIKKFREVSQAYSLAGQELTSIESLGRHVNDQKALSEFVINAENAISREHTMWCAKRM